MKNFWSPLGLAVSAALSGKQVHIFFQGPATRLLKKEYNASLEGLSKPFSRFARKSLADMSHLPANEKIQQLKEFGSVFYICGGSMDHFGVKEQDLIFNDIIIALRLRFVSKKLSILALFFESHPIKSSSCGPGACS